MDCLVVDNVKNLRVNTKYLAKGSTARCYRTKDGKVLKQFRNTYRARTLFRLNDDIEGHFNRLSELNNDTYVGPEVLIKSLEDRIVAYYMEYRNARTIKKFRSNIRLYDLINPYRKLIVDTKVISEARFRLQDLHTENILFNGLFHVIDLDHGRFDEYHTEEDILKYNMCDLVHTIIDGMFGVSYFKDIYFNDIYLDELYKRLTNDDYELFFEFISKLEDLIGIKNPTIGQLKRNRGLILTLQKREDYYGRYMF